jgi:hypothetical protein
MDRASQWRAATVIIAAYAAGAAWLWLGTGGQRVTEAIGFSNSLLIAFLLPTAAVIVLWLFQVVESRRPVCRREPGDGAATERILLRLIAFIGGLHGLILLQLTLTPSGGTLAPQLPIFLVGALLVSVGNLLPTTRPNVFVGIRTRRSLHSRHFWIEIHRFGGYVSVGLGLVMIVGAVVLGFPLMMRVTGVAILAAAGMLGMRYLSLVRTSERV